MTFRAQWEITGPFHAERDCKGASSVQLPDDLPPPWLRTSILTDVVYGALIYALASTTTSWYSTTGLIASFMASRPSAKSILLSRHFSKDTAPDSKPIMDQTQHVPSRHSSQSPSTATSCHLSRPEPPSLLEMTEWLRLVFAYLFYCDYFNPLW